MIKTKRYNVVLQHIRAAHKYDENIENIENNQYSNYFFSFHIIMHFEIWTIPKVRRSKF